MTTAEDTPYHIVDGSPEESTTTQPDRKSIDSEYYHHGTEIRDGRPYRVRHIYPSLQYWPYSGLLFIFYVPLVIIAWSLTYVMSNRPISYPSYINQQGKYTPHIVQNFEHWWTAVRVMNSVISLVTVPIISAMLAHGTIVYTQRQRTKQKLTFRQTLALADRGWTNIGVLFGSLSKASQTSSWFLWLAFVILVINAIQQPIQQLLVSSETIQIVSSSDVTVFSTMESISSNGIVSYSAVFDQTVLGYDPEPIDLASIPQDLVVQDIIKKTSMASNRDFQLQMWPTPLQSSGGHLTDPELEYDSPNNLNNTLSFYTLLPENYFISALPNGTTTGILREHALRFNSSMQANTTTFPENCDGDNPFQTAYDFQESSYRLQIRVCVPGNQSQVPWTLIRNRQDIEERAYLHVDYTGETSANFTVEFLATSTRGYFELGNIHTDYEHGDLLENWPSPDDLRENYNDYIAARATGEGIPTEFPTTWDNDTDHTVEWQLPLLYPNNATQYTKTPGPLTTSMIALFGDRSFLKLASQNTTSNSSKIMESICQANNVPFVRFCAERGQRQTCDGFTKISQMCTNQAWKSASLPDFIYKWVQIFNSQDGVDLGSDGRLAMQSAVYFALESTLLQTQSTTSCSVDTCNSATTSRPIFTSPGVGVTKPLMSSAGRIVVTTLLALQVVTLIGLTYYIYSIPTWATSFDSYSVARMGSALGSLPTLGEVKDVVLEDLSKEDGLIGILEEFEGKEGAFMPRLGLGAPGLVNRRAQLQATTVKTS